MNQPCRQPGLETFLRDDQTGVSRCEAVPALAEPVEDQGWMDFRDQCRRQMQRPLDQRIRYGFCRMYKPVLDDARWRAFDTLPAYREWCAAHLPGYLGFQPAKP